jgi:hypothetical protein
VAFDRTKPRNVVWLVGADDQVPAPRHDAGAT